MRAAVRPAGFRASSMIHDIIMFRVFVAQQLVLTHPFEASISRTQRWSPARPTKVWIAPPASCRPCPSHTSPPVCLSHLPPKHDAQALSSFASRAKNMLITHCCCRRTEIAYTTHSQLLRPLLPVGHAPS